MRVGRPVAVLDPLGVLDSERIGSSGQEAFRIGGPKQGNYGKLQMRNCIQSFADSFPFSGVEAVNTQELGITDLSVVNGILNGWHACKFASFASIGSIFMMVKSSYQ